MTYYLEDPIDNKTIDFPNFKTAQKYMKDNYGIKLKKEGKCYTAYYWHHGLKEGFIFCLFKEKS